MSAQPIGVPPRACDCHVHVFDPARFPFAADAAYHPVAAECGTVVDLAATLDSAGIDRVVLVNPTSGYGEDNRCMLDAIERLDGRARGIARVPTSVTGRALDALARRGVAGVRLDFIAAGIALADDPELPRLIAKLAERDLVLDVQAEGEQWMRLAPMLRSAPVRVVVDHAGRPRPQDGVNAPGFRALLALADTGRVAVKLSGAMRYSQRPPPYADVDRFVSRLVQAFGAKRLVFGSDWPFLRVDRRVDYLPMLALLARAVPSAAERRTILASTAARWFGF
jgi:predicted TIM-barrel fold metal-dependent hydrolase